MKIEMIYHFWGIYTSEIIIYVLWYKSPIFISAFPTFEEVVVEKRVKEDYEEWDHSPNFTPRYPFYQSKTEEPREIAHGRDQKDSPSAPSMIDNFFDSVKKTDMYKSFNKKWNKNNYLIL